MVERKADTLIEVSYEIGNKVGGIYTVIKSKALQMEKYYDGNYITIGFYDPGKAKYELEPLDPEKFAPAFEKIHKLGGKCHYGTWNIPGKPKTILIDCNLCMHKSNEIKGKLWDDFKIDSLGTGPWFDTPIVWSTAAGYLVDELSKVIDGQIVAHHHEWLTGGSLLHLKKINSPVATVFTTHATILGRTMAGASREFYADVEKGLESDKTIDPDEAYRYKVNAKHQTEAVCAKEADVFTTVSKTTAREVEYILGKRADVILPNGLDMSGYPAMEELSYLHKKNKAKIAEFLQSYFSPYYNVNLDDFKIVFTSGRYEFENKGLDIFISSLGDVNKKLKAEGKKNNNVFAFIFVPADVGGPTRSVLENISLYAEVEDHIDDELPSIKNNIMESLTGGEELDNVFSDEFRKKYKRLMLKFKSRKGQIPSICAFNLNYDERNDPILEACKKAGLFNRENDPVKVIFYPVYLSSADGMLSLDYTPTVIGSSLGVFPSYYEPWGYTPLESAANGAIAVTTDLGGFGQFILENSDQKKERGVKVLRWKNKTDSEVTDELSEYMYSIATASKEESIALKNSAKKLSTLADWQILSENYIKAHNLAIERMIERRGE